MKFSIQKYTPRGYRTVQDTTAAEEPLQITLDGVPVAVVMRTPGDDHALIMGFLITEGIVESVEQISRVDLEWKKNHGLVFLKEDVEVDLTKLQRNLYSASSCGICGKASIEAILQQVCPIPTQVEIAPEVILAVPDRLREQQSLFDSTGGIHAAGIFNLEGELLASAEDVGRHNAVDKVIGKIQTMVDSEAPLFLQVSGRVSFELVQKALMARLVAVVAISAPSSLAVEFARETNMQLFGFVRGEGFNKYA